MKKNKFRSTLLASVASATFALTSTNASARPEGAIALPSAPAIENMQEVQFIGRDELMSYQDIGDFEFLYEPEYISALVQEGKLPPIWERLPKRPLVFNGDAMDHFLLDIQLAEDLKDGTGLLHNIKDGVELIIQFKNV